MEREVIELALTELDELLGRDSADEDEYQVWFERQPIVFAALGFREARPKPRILSPSGEEWIPDFLVLGSSNWEIFEIKTPDADVLLDRERRSKFYAHFESYVSQTQEYVGVLDDPRARDDLKERTGIELYKRPRITIVAGRSIGIDREKLEAVARSRMPPLQILTYDDVRSQLEFYRTFHFGKYETSNGYGFAAVVVLARSPSRYENNFIVDLGEAEERDRVSVFVNPSGYLRMNVYDSDGRLHEARSVQPLEPDDFGIPHLLLLTAGVGDGFGFLSIVIDKKYRADLRISDFRLNLSPHHVLGSDITGLAPSYMCVAAHMLLKKPIGYRDRLAIWRWAERYHVQRTQADPTAPWIVFRGRQSGRSAGHPYTSGPTAAPSFGPCPWFRR